MSPICDIRTFLIHYLFKQSSNAFFIMIMMIFAHTIESIYVCFLLMKANLHTKALVSWMLLTAFLGYPVTRKAQLLNKAAAIKQD